MNLHREEYITLIDPLIAFSLSLMVFLTGCGKGINSLDYTDYEKRLHGYFNGF
jgi:hypothetical protein